MRNLEIALALAVVTLTGLVHGAGLDAKSVEEITGLTGTWEAARKTFTISSNREDVNITVDGRTVPPTLDLGSVVSFTSAGHGNVRLTGQFALFADEVNPLLTVGFENGLEIMALRHRFFYDEPRIYLLEVSAELPAENSARGVRRMLDRVKQIRSTRAQPATGFGGPQLPPTNNLSSSLFESVLGLALKDSGASGLKLEVLDYHGASISAVFTGTDDMAAVNGTFVVPQDDSQMLIRALRHWDLNIIGIHPCASTVRMGTNRRSAVRVDYYGAAKPPRLAQAVHTALDTLKK